MNSAAGKASLGSSKSAGSSSEPPVTVASIDSDFLPLIYEVVRRSVLLSFACVVRVCDSETLAPLTLCSLIRLVWLPSRDDDCLSHQISLVSWGSFLFLFACFSCLPDDALPPRLWRHSIEKEMLDGSKSMSRESQDYHLKVQALKEKLDKCRAQVNAIKGIEMTKEEQVRRVDVLKVLMTQKRELLSNYKNRCPIEGVPRTE